MTEVQHPCSPEPQQTVKTRLESVSFAAQYQGHPVSLLAYELEHSFSRFSQMVEVVSKHEIALGPPHTVPYQNENSFKIENFPIKRKVSLKSTSRVWENWGRYRLDDPKCTVLVENEVVFTGPLEEAAKKVREIIMEDLKPLLHFPPAHNVRTLKSIAEDKTVSDEASHIAQLLCQVVSAESKCVLENGFGMIRFILKDPIVYWTDNYGVQQKRQTSTTQILRRDYDGTYNVIHLDKEFGEEVHARTKPITTLGSALGILSTELLFWSCK